jgi:hypothetical protein
MSGINGEISRKNEAINRLNHTTGNVYDIRLAGANTSQEIVANKNRLNNPGTVPDGFWSEEMKLTRKDWKIIVAAVLFTVLIAYILFKTKVIKL